MIDHELNGYKEKPPVYRILDAGVKIKIQTEEIIDIRRPMDMIRNESVRKKLNYMPVFLPIVEIEQITKSRLDIITEDLPRPIWDTLQFYADGGEIQRAYQYVNVIALCNIPVSVKYLLMDYFLKIDKNEEINFESLMQKDKKEMIFNTTYNTAVLNTGPGSVNAANATNIIGNDNNISISNIKELKQILDKIEESLKLSKHKECNDVIKDAKEELSKQDPSKKVLKHYLQVIKDIFSKATTAVAATEIANNVIPLITKALTLL